MRWLRSRERRELVLDWVFLIGVLLKAVDGLIELVFGIPALFISPAQLVSLTSALTAGELAADPHDLLANLLLRATSGLSADALLVSGGYLIVHGAVKVAIVVALVLGSRRVYPWSVGALGVLLIVQLVDLILAFSIGVLLLVVLDSVIIWLTVREWQHGRTLRDVARLRMPWLDRRVRNAGAAGN